MQKLSDFAPILHHYHIDIFLIPLSISISISIFLKDFLSISISISIFSELPYQYQFRYRYFPKLPYRYRYRYRYFSKVSIYRQSIFDIDISNRARCKMYFAQVILDVGKTKIYLLKNISNMGCKYVFYGRTQ